MQPREFLTLFAVVFIGMLGYGLMVPLIPLMALKLGVSKTFITWVVATYALAQLVGAPVWGHLSDKFGRRPVLIWTVAVSFVGYVLLAVADSLWLLLLSRAIGGFSAGNLSTAYAYVSDRTSAKERARAIGRISAAFGMGFMVGPAIGGFLAGGTTVGEADFARPALAAALMSAAALVATYLFLPESRDPVPHRAATAAPGPTFLAKNAALLRRPALVTLAGLTLLAFVTTSVLQSTFPLWMQSQLGFAALEVGLVYSYNGIVITATQGLIVGPLAERFGERRMLQCASVLFAAGLAGLIHAQGVVLLLASTTMSAFATGIFSTCLPTQFSHQTSPGDRGAIIALYQSTGSFSRFLGPTFSGALFERVAVSAPFWFGIGAMAVSLLLTFVLGRVTGGTAQAGDGGDGNSADSP